MKIKSLDIETVANRTLIEQLPEPEVALGNTKDPEKIREKIAEAKARQIEKMTLDPFFSRVCSFATWSNDQASCGFNVIDSISDAAEINIINKIFDECFSEGSCDTIITWNGFSFDIPFIYKRAMLLKIELPPKAFPMSWFTKKYSSHPHCDIMQELVGWAGNGYLSLDTAGAMILGERKSKALDFSTFQELIETGRSSEIGIYNLKDAELTFRIYEHASKYLF